MELILEEELGALIASYLERTTKEVLPCRTMMITNGIVTPMLTVKMEKLLEDQEVNEAYWYHSTSRDT
jgi:hypothetical protein